MIDHQTIEEQTMRKCTCERSFAFASASTYDIRLRLTITTSQLIDTDKSLDFTCLLFGIDDAVSNAHQANLNVMHDSASVYERDAASP